MGPSKILYLDDSDMLLEMFTQNIQEWGFCIDTFNHYNDALKALKDQPLLYNVFLIDYKMPTLNGIDFIQLLQKYNYFGTKNIVLFSSMVKQKEIQDELIQKVPGARQSITCIEKGADHIHELRTYLNMSQPEAQRRRPSLKN